MDASSSLLESRLPLIQNQRHQPRYLAEEVKKLSGVLDTTAFKYNAPIYSMGEVGNTALFLEIARERSTEAYAAEDILQLALQFIMTMAWLLILLIIVVVTAVIIIICCCCCLCKH